MQRQTGMLYLLKNKQCIQHGGRRHLEFPKSTPNVEPLSRFSPFDRNASIVTYYQAVLLNLKLSQKPQMMADFQFFTKMHRYIQ